MKSIGKVYLIGAGCGDWELITLKGLRYLKTCDCLIYDRLISKKLLDLYPKIAKRYTLANNVDIIVKLKRRLTQY